MPEILLILLHVKLSYIYVYTRLTFRSSRIINAIRMYKTRAFKVTRVLSKRRPNSSGSLAEKIITK